MATKSFQTEFTFSSKSASALANALDRSKRVDVKFDQPVKRYTKDSLKKTTKFDNIFGKGERN
ncbi:MAG: hypothetical protein LKF36_00070 [Lactobacillus sp.]|jgi:hypothetical protein|nr:hypothetical protein [Lactobacillus sp.]